MDPFPQCQPALLFVWAPATFHISSSGRGCFPLLIPLSALCPPLFIFVLSATALKYHLHTMKLTWKKTSSSVVLRMRSDLCDLHRKLSLQHFICRPQRNPLAVLPHAPPRPEGTSSRSSVRIDLPLLNIWRKWNHTYMAFWVWVLSLNMRFGGSSMS